MKRKRTKNGTGYKPHVSVTCRVCKLKFLGFSRTCFCNECRWDVLALQQKVSIGIVRKIREGKMLRADSFKCKDCGRPAECYDHRDYTKPFKVDAVCTGCNIRRGPARKYF